MSTTHTICSFFFFRKPENLKSYHYGLKTLFDGYNIPIAIDHLYSIRSHPKYKGKVIHNQLLTHDLYHLIEEGSSDIGIFESEFNNEYHFYLLYPKGLRHFTIQQSNNLAMLENGMGRNYPNLNYLIRCTTQIG